ncbi:hypothetical protein [Sinorhizobium psoraleae]|uniref:Uncharacterized protein n=1 Tax=Sinorhizobium psoraleae TaxID=520838 RepID=A0ABT4KI91_9HYPH|nr:hypothetical protein [Sinorhizobium psoraleae]MCZ4091672.1 hypothetical protein [Sinorhizobium psoraleae]
MDKLHIAKGDFLTAVVDPHDPEIPLNAKTIVIAARGAAGIAAEELSARQVIRDGGKILLRCQSQGAVFPDIEVGEKTSEANVYSLPDGGFVRIEGVVASVMRQYPL